MLDAYNNIHAGTCASVPAPQTNTFTGKIVVAKATTGSNATFDYTGRDGAGASAVLKGLPLNFTVTTAGGPPGAGSKTFSVLTGAYRVQETPEAGWTFSPPIVCVDPTTNSAPDGGINIRANINVAGGETVTCTWSNTFP